jgi:hypothetical protein
MKTKFRISTGILMTVLLFSCSDMIANLGRQVQAPVVLPGAKPFNNYTVSASQFYSGTATAWQWTVTGGPGDQLFDQTVGTRSFTLTGANTATLTFYAMLSGPYPVTLTVTTPNRGVLTFSSVINVGTDGITVELCWDKTGTTDLDLHLHRSGTTTQWFGASVSSPNTDDCYYLTGRATNFVSGVGIDWGYAASCLCLCRDAPQGVDWQTYGSCPNPRLSVDNISTPGVPEVINLDNPNNGETFRVMVHFYGGVTTVVKPIVFVFCNGQLVGSYGSPLAVSGFDHPGSWGAGPMWRVVDITPQVSGGRVTGCTLTPLHPAGMTTGYLVTNNDKTY